MPTPDKAAVRLASGDTTLVIEQWRRAPRLTGLLERLRRRIDEQTEVLERVADQRRIDDDEQGDYA